MFRNFHGLLTDRTDMRLARGLKNIVRRFIGDCCGPTATEYAVLLVLIIFGALTAISLLGSFVGGSMETTAKALPSGDGGSGGGGSDKPAKKPKKGAPRRRSVRGDYQGGQYVLVWADEADQASRQS